MQLAVRVVSRGWANRAYWTREDQRTAPGRRIEDADGNVWREGGLWHRAPIDVARDSGTVLCFNEKSSALGFDYLRAQVFRGADGKMGLAPMMIVAKPEDMEAARELKRKLRRIAQEMDAELRFERPAPEERSDEEPMRSVIHGGGTRNGYQSFAKNMDTRTLRERAWEILGTPPSAVYVANAALEECRADGGFDVRARAKDIFAAAAGYGVYRYAEGSRREKHDQAARAGFWMYAHDALPEPFKANRTMDDDAVDESEKAAARVMRLGRSVVNVGGKRPRFSQMPGDPDEVVAEVDRRAEYVQRMLDRELRPMAA
jgi:hypothetical protein